MRLSLHACVALLSCAALHAADHDYDAELRRAMRLYPPGDYGRAPVRPFSPVFEASRASKVALDHELVTPVEVSEKDAKTLSSEAASFFISGRWDLAVKRYEQLLLADPKNVAAKAHIYDIVMLRSLYNDDARRSVASKKHAEMCEELSKDIIPSGAK